MKQFVLITGLSGGGKSQAAGIFEDMGYYCVDNLPQELLPRFIEVCLAADGKYDRVVLVSDLRAYSEFDGLLEEIRKWKALGVDLQVLFMEASEEAILNRYKATRHRHPLDREGVDVLEAIRREKEKLRPLRENADVVLNTTGFNLNQLKLHLSKLYAPEDTAGMNVHICSFGFRHGLPEGADLVWDVRFLPNPYYIPEMKKLTGLDRSVHDYVCSFPETTEFIRMLRELLHFLLPRYQAEGKTSLLIAIGCTGGQHRSVTIAEELTGIVRSLGYAVDCTHRDVE